MNEPEPTGQQIRAVVLASGGLDSCVAAARTVSEYGPEATAMLHLTYGQRTAVREERSFRRIAERLEVTRQMVIPLESLGRMGGSSLTDRSVPVPRSGSTGPGRIPSSYVPFRNTVMVSLGVAWAETLGAGSVVIGAVQTDSPGYPDCREAYFEALNQLVDTGTRPETKIHVETPLIRLSKTDIVRLGAELGAPFELTWSCYTESETACGVCESCRLRLEGFELAGIDDPLAYAPPAGGLNR